MSKRIILIAFFLQMVVALSCATNKNPSTEPLSGSEMTTEWINFNKQADINNTPKLVYLATCRKVIEPNGIAKTDDITSHFSLKDEKFYVFTRWSNVFDKHLFKLKVLDPRGVLFKEWDSLYSYNGPGWNLWSYIFIRNAPAARLPGKWTAEIYMDNRMAAKKEFYLGNNNTLYEKIAFDSKTPAIAVARFQYTGNGGKRFSWRMPDYIARMLSIDYPECKVVLPSEVMRYCSLSNIDNLEGYIKNIAQSPLLDDLIERYNIELLILGSINDDAIVGETKIFKTYIIDTKNKAVLNKTTTYWSSLHTYKDNFSQLILYGSSLVYDKTIKEGKRYFDKLAQN